MSTFFIWYMVAWGTACAIALAVAVADRRRLVLIDPAYWRAQLVPWKLTTFGIASAGLVVIAPYTGDITWDYVDAAFMSMLTYATAPWAVGVLFRAARGRERLRQAYVAACAWLFSASWSYDLYIVLRDDDYPVTWAANIVASSVLYACAGLFWSLERHPRRGVIFAFMAPEWPAAPAHRDFRGVLWFALPFMLIVAGMILPFLLS